MVQSCTQLRAAFAARNMGDVFPVLLSSFGCTPGSFTEPVFQSILEGYPYIILETDSHGGVTGYITRIQAFLHTVSQYKSTQRPKKHSKINEIVNYIEHISQHQLLPDHNTRYVLFALPCNLASIIAATYRSFGFDVVAATSTAESFAMGKRDCSGKECLPYQVMWGSFRKYLQDNPTDKKTVLLQLRGETPCKNGMFNIKYTISLHKLAKVFQFLLLTIYF